VLLPLDLSKGLSRAHHILSSIEKMLFLHKTILLFASCVIILKGVCHVASWTLFQFCSSANTNWVKSCGTSVFQPPWCTSQEV